MTDQTADLAAQYRARTSKELGLAGNHYDAIQAHLDAYETAVADRALATARQAAGQPAADEHSCRSCEGVDPDTCLMNPERPKQPLAIPRDVAQAIHDAFGQLLTAPAAGLAAPTNHDTEAPDDMPQLFALQRAITDSGGTLTRDVHTAIDALRNLWDAALQQAQRRAAGAES